MTTSAFAPGFRTEMREHGRQGRVLRTSRGGLEGVGIGREPGTDTAKSRRPPRRFPRVDVGGSLASNRRAVGSGYWVTSKSRTRVAVSGQARRLTARSILHISARSVPGQDFGRIKVVPLKTAMHCSICPGIVVRLRRPNGRWSS